MAQRCCAMILTLVRSERLLIDGSPPNGVHALTWIAAVALALSSCFAPRQRQLR